MSEMSIVESSLYPQEGIQEATEGDEPVWAMRKEGVTTIADDATLAMYVYKNATDATSEMTTGAMSASGNVVVLKKFQSLKAGDRLHVCVCGTCDGVFYTFGKFWLYVHSRSGKK